MIILGHVRLSKGYLCPARLEKELGQGPAWLEPRIAHWFRNVKIDQQFKNSKNIDFRENIPNQEMSIYAKAKSLLICTINV